MMVPAPRLFFTAHQPRVVVWRNDAEDPAIVRSQLGPAHLTVKPARSRSARQQPGRFVWMVQLGHQIISAGTSPRKTDAKKAAEAIARSAAVTGDRK